MTTRESMACPFCKNGLVFVRVTNGDWGLCCPECCFSLPTFPTKDEAGDKGFELCDQIALRLAASIQGAVLSDDKAAVLRRHGFDVPADGIPLTKQDLVGVLRSGSFEHAVVNVVLEAESGSKVMGIMPHKIGVSGVVKRVLAGEKLNDAGRFIGD